MRSLHAALFSLALAAAGCCCSHVGSPPPEKVTQPWQTNWQQFAQKLAPILPQQDWGSTINCYFDNRTVEWSGTVDEIQPLPNIIRQHGILITNGIAKMGNIRVSMPPVTFAFPDGKHLTVNTLDLFPANEAEWKPWASLTPRTNVKFRTVLHTDNGFRPVARVFDIEGEKTFQLITWGAVLLAERTRDP